MKIGLIFPGYGSQFVGMCKELYDSSRLVQEYFEEASNCLNTNVIKLCFASSDAELSKMQNAFPAIFLVSSALFTLLKEEGIQPHVVAGYNTGEFAALAAANGLTFPDGLYLLNKYAIAYQELLCELKDATILRVIGLSTQELQEVCQKIRDSGMAVNIAFYCGPTEHMVSGFVPALEQIEKYCNSTCKIKITPVDLEMGLHSSLMDPVVARISMYAEKVDFHDLEFPVISGLSGQPICTGDQVKTDILNHPSSSICWNKVLSHFESCDVILEIGPGDRLHSTLQACYPNKQIYTINKPEDFQNVKLVCPEKEKTTDNQSRESFDEHI